MCEDTEETHITFPAIVSRLRHFKKTPCKVRANRSDESSELELNHCYQAERDIANFVLVLVQFIGYRCKLPTAAHLVNQSCWCGMVKTNGFTKTKTNRSVHKKDGFFYKEKLLNLQPANLPVAMLVYPSSSICIPSFKKSFFKETISSTKMSKCVKLAAISLLKLSLCQASSQLVSLCFNVSEHILSEICVCMY